MALHLGRAELQEELKVESYGELAKPTD